MILLTKLILAHLIGDFLLQPRSGLRQKETLTWRSPFLYLHVTVHFLLVLIITADAGLWDLALLIALAHWLIDGCKVHYQTERSRPAWFFADQGLHLLAIVLLWMSRVSPDGLPVLSPAALWQPDYWPVLLAAVFLTVPASTIIQHLMMKWDGAVAEDETASLKNAGMYIGILERIFIFISILSGFWQTVGFLLAAKSVFRFGDLTKSGDRKLTEYVLIGTLFSFGLALAAAAFFVV
ncbi:MAG: DUF3307 domain-containing protein [Balneolaceae bacterium]